MLQDEKKKYNSLALNESEAIFKTSIESLPFDVFIINKDGYYVTQNSTCKQHWGDLIGKKPEDVANNEDTLAIWRNNNSKAFSGETVKGEVSFSMNGMLHYYYNIISPVYVNNEIEYIIGINIDITDSKKVEQKLQESEEKYKDTIEMLPDIIYEANLDLYLTYANSVAFHKFGYTFEDLETGIKITDFLDPSSIKKAMIQIKSLLEGNPTKPEQYILRKKDGSTFFARIHSRPIFKDSKVVGIRGTIMDVNDIVLKEKELEESKEQFSKISEQSLLGIAIMQDDRFKYLNQKFANMGGRTVDEVRNWGPREYLAIVHPEDRSRVIEQSKKRQLGLDTKISGYECRCLKKNGETMWIQTYSKTILFNGKYADLITTVDITDNKKAEQKLKESEDKFRTIAEQSLIGMCILQNFEIKYLNQQMADIYGYSLDEIKEWKPSEFIKVIHPDYKEMVIDQIKKKQKGLGNVSAHYIAKIIRKDGKTRWVENYSKNIIYQGKHADFLTQIDITDKILAEQKLSASEEKYRHLYEKSPFAILLVDLNGEIIDNNVAAELLSGFKKKELIGKNFANTNFIPREYIYTVVQDFKALLKKGIIEPKEIQLYTNDKRHVWVSYQASIITIENEKIIQIMIENISERKKVEENLKESEKKYHKLFETSPDGVVLTDLNGIILEVNSALKNITGYSPKEFLGKNFINLDIYYENAHEVLLEVYEDLLNENILDPTEFPIKTKSNKINWVRITATLINMKGKTYILAVIHDITALKEVEEAVRKNESKFRDILETSSVGVMELDIVNNKLLYINPKLLNIVGFSKDELNEDVFRHYIIHPKDLTKLLKCNEEEELEFQVKDKQGKLKWLAGKRIPHYNESGEINSIRVWVDDITEKKMYENLIYELNINFLNFTTDIRKNIDLLLDTCLKLLEGRFLLYVHKLISDEQEIYQIITSEKKIFNYSSQEFHQLFISVLFQEEHDFPQTFTDIDQIIYAKSDPFLIEHKFKGCFGKIIKSHEGPNGAVCIFYRNNPVISGIDKLVLFLICDAIEIEQRRWQVQKDLEKQNITLNKINKLKSELFSRTSHELKTPLISIKGFTELLLTLYKPKLDPEIISILKEISEGSNRLEKIINLLLDSTKLEAGQLSLNLLDEDLAFLIRFCVKELQGLAKLRDQTISLKLQEKLKTKFDKERIYEVMSNLVVNAIKYTPPGGKIVIESKINEDSYEVSVKDNGIGFTEEEKIQVFRQFGKIERYGQGWDIAADGTGLGLYITKKLVELHGGKIWLESEGRNKGTTFYFSIPILK
ncbi:MAG: PAS domain S-box protein [Promethearchaeota archaeon]